MTKTVFIRVALLSTFLAANISNASPLPLIEVGVDVNFAAAQPIDAETFSVASGYSFGGNASFNFLFLNMDADFVFDRFAAENTFEIGGSAGLLFLKVHEIYYRVGGPNGDQMRGFAGFGSSFDLPKELGVITASLGAGVIDWERPGEESQVLYGGYAGAKILLKIWKLKNELQVAYYIAPSITEDLESVEWGETEFIERWNHGIVASEKIRIDIFKLPLLSFGPEARARLVQLPDGTEWSGTVGFGGNFGL